MFLGSKTLIFWEIPPLAAEIQSRRHSVVQVKCPYLLFEYDRYIPRVGNVCGGHVWIFQEGPFPGSTESDKKIHCFSGKVLKITDGSQQDISWL
jgi:hypothetical protein